MLYCNLKRTTIMSEQRIQTPAVIEALLDPETPEGSIHEGTIVLTVLGKITGANGVTEGSSSSGKADANSQYYW
jgi:hypothetical protein